MPEPVHCGARTRSGGTCRRAPAAGRTRCRLHGGASLAGAASPSFKHGRYSRYLPTRLAEAYEAALADDALIVMRDELGLVDSRLAELIANVDREGFVQQWQHARNAFESFTLANQRGDSDGMQAALRELNTALNRGLGDQHKWREIVALVESRRRVVETEQRRLERGANAMTAERAMVLLHRIVDIIRRHVSDPGILSAIAVEVKALATVQPELPQPKASRS